MPAGAPNGIRTRAAALKGRCPRPLDDGGSRLSPPLPVASAVGDCPSIGDRDHNQQKRHGPKFTRGALAAAAAEPTGVRQDPLARKSQVKTLWRMPPRRAGLIPLPTRLIFDTLSDVSMTERGHYSDAGHAGEPCGRQRTAEGRMEGAHDG